MRLLIVWMTVVLCGAMAVAQDRSSTEPLCQAAMEGDLAKVRTLLAGGANPNLRDEQAQTPLMRAAAALRRRPAEAADYAGVVNALLDRGAKIDERDGQGRTALLWATEGAASEYRVIGADDAIVRLLVGRGANVNLQDQNGWSPLLNLLHLWADQPELLAFLLDQGADVHARLKDGRTGLMLVASLGKDERIPLLLDRGAEINAKDNTGATALMMAAIVRWEEISVQMIQALVGKGADLNAVDNSGRTAADRAAEAGYLARARLLLDKGTRVASVPEFLRKARNLALAREVSEGAPEAIEALLKEGADPDFIDADGRSMLMIAAENEYSADRVRLLLGYRAQVNRAGKGGMTPLMVAADRYQAEIVKVLLDAGAGANAVDEAGNTVLLHAAGSRRSWQEEEKPLMHLLLAKGAEPNRANRHGVTALMLMAGAGNPALPQLLAKGATVDARDDEGNTALLYAARFFVGGWERRDGWALLQKGADVNAANRQGETAIILAATQYEADAVRLLLEKGANVNARTKTGRTALMQAIDGPKEFDNDHHRVYSPAIARVLIQSGADVNARDDEGNTPLGLARKRGYSDMAAELQKAGARD